MNLLIYSVSQGIFSTLAVGLVREQLLIELIPFEWTDADHAYLQQVEERFNTRTTPAL